MTTTMDIIRTMYPDRITLSVEELAPLLPLSPQYIRKEVRAGRFLIPWRRIGSRIMFPVSAVVAILDNSSSPIAPRHPGRPTKAEVIARERQASGQK